MALVSPLFKENSENCAWVGGGTQAIMLLLQEMGIYGKLIAVPVSVCPSLIQAVLYSGNQPYYVDICEGNLGMSPEALQQCIEKVSAVIAVHSFGTVCSIKEIYEICCNHNKFLIEDCAQALGAHVNGQPVGAFGDAAIFSFGAGKIIDLGFGGAAISDNITLTNRVKASNALMPEWTSRSENIISNISTLHTSLYNSFYPDEIRQHAGAFINAVLNGKTAYMFRPPHDFPGKAIYCLTSLDQNLAYRMEKATQFKEIFEHAGIHFHWPAEGGVFWRFNIFLENNRDNILRALLAEGFKVSSWYPRVDLFMRTEPSGDGFPVADRIGAEILNLWVNMEIDDLYIEQVSKRIIKYIKTGA